MDITYTNTSTNQPDFFSRFVGAFCSSNDKEVCTIIRAEALYIVQQL